MTARNPEEPLPEVQEIEPTQMGVANYLLDHHGDEMLHVIEGGKKGGHAWFVWSERGWVRDHNDTIVYRWVVKVGIEMRKHAAGVLRENSDDKPAKLMMKQAMALRSNNGVEAVLRAAQRLRDPKSMEDWDNDPRALACTNGVLYLLDRKPFYEFVKWSDITDRDQCLLMRNTGVEFDPLAKHRLWDSALKTFLPDKKVQTYLGRLLSNCLIDGNPDGKMLFAIGPSNSGKSAVANAIMSALGRGEMGYGGPLDASVLRGGGAGPSEPKAMVMRKRFAVGSELDKQKTVHADVVKSLTGGDATIYHGKFKAGSERSPDFLPLATANSGLRVKGADEALRERFIAIPFSQHQPKKDGRAAQLRDDPKVKRAVLAWLVQCWVDRQTHGLPVMPKAVERKTAELFSGASLVTEFIDQRCTVDEDKSSRLAEFDDDLWDAFREYMDVGEVAREDRIDRSTFLKDLHGLGYKSGPTRHVRGHEGETKRARCGLRLKRAKSGAVKAKARGT